MLSVYFKLLLLLKVVLSATIFPQFIAEKVDEYFAKENIDNPSPQEKTVARKLIYECEEERQRTKEERQRTNEERQRAVKAEAEAVRVSEHKIYLMAVWTLDLLPYTIGDAINTTQRLPPKHGRNYGTANQYKTAGRKFNATILSKSTTTLSPVPADNVTLSSAASSTTTISIKLHDNLTASVPASSNTKHIKVRAKKKNAITRKTKPKQRIRANNTKFITRSEKDLLPKSNMQVLQFYAQPLNAIELKGQALPTFVDSGSDDAMRELPVLTVNPAHSPPAISHSQVYMAPSNYPNTVSYKTIPDEYVYPFKPMNYNTGVERPAAALSPIPILEPYGVYKRNPKPRALPLMPVPPAQKFVATIRSVTPPPVPLMPPVTVTRVYKYTSEDRSPAFKLPFLENDDPIDENLPILSAALDDRLNDRVAGLSIRSYMTPPKLGQPILYGSGPRVTATLPDVYTNEYQILSKFNENLQTHPSGGFEDETSGRDKENYSEEEVKKALKYIQRLKKGKPSLNRGRITYKNSQQFRNLKRKPGGKNSDENANDDMGEEEEAEHEQIAEDKKKRKKEHDPYSIDDVDDEEIDDTFQAKSFTEDADKNQEESRRETVKASAESKADDDPLETHEAVPSVDNKIDGNEPFENAKLGVDNDGDDRVEFQMHGLGGAESYKFGYDTGKGENRQFRYEERDANGKVKGHFGYYDRDGKLQLFNYEADPELGYHLEKAADH